MENTIHVNELCHIPDHHEHSHEGITVSIHEDAIVVSGHREMQGVLEKVKNTLVQEMEILGEWIVEQRGVIGHLKAYTESPALPKDENSEERKRKDITNVHINIVAIIYYINVMELECRIAQIFDRCLSI